MKVVCSFGFCLNADRSSINLGISTLPEFHLRILGLPQKTQERIFQTSPFCSSIVKAVVPDHALKWVKSWPVADPFGSPLSQASWELF